jgi:hypothetical protein
MNLIPALFFSKDTRPRSGRLVCVLTLSLTIFLSTAVSAFAEPVRINQLVQTLSPQGTSSLKVDMLVSQDPPGTKGATQPHGSGNEKQDTQTPRGDSLLSGIAVASDAQQAGIEIIEEGEVEGTICDCGEILIAAAGFPKWPLVFLTAVPFIFIKNCETCDLTPNPTPPSIPTPTPVPTPEPRSLLLLGTGLLAAGLGLRRRYERAKLKRLLRG